MITGFALIAGFSLSLYGWGGLLRRALRLPEGPWPITAALGMAVVVFLGGLLNLARLAYSSALITVGVAGVVLAFCFVGRVRWAISLHRAVVWALAALAAGFTLWTQSPPRVYNHHDDFQKYFPQVVRMLETGTLMTGSALSSVGSQTLGGQGFLQGFLVALVPISYIGEVDTVFGLFLCLMLAGELTGRRRDLLAVTVMAMIAVVTINPQIVNITAVYTGAALLMAAAALATEPEPPDPVAIGLVYAALAALKPTWGLFVIPHLLFEAIATGWRWSLRAALSGAAFLAPWLLREIPLYLAGWRGAGGAENIAPNAETWRWFSWQLLDYGASTAAYTLLFLMIALCGLLAAWAVREKPLRARAMAAVFAAGLAAYLLVVLAAPLQFGYAQAVRYSAPFAIALFPAALGRAALYLDARPAASWIAAGLAALVVTPFFPVLRDRIHESAAFGSQLAFTWVAEDPEYLEHNRQVLHGSAAMRVNAMQKLVPAGEPLIAWMETPFYLDFARNPIVNVESQGLSLGTPALPSARYLILQYDGLAMATEEDELDPDNHAGALDRRMASRSVELRRRVATLAAQGQSLYDDGECKVVRLF